MPTTATPTPESLRREQQRAPAAAAPATRATPHPPTGRRAAETLAALLLYGLLAAAVMLPFHSGRFRHAGDLVAHVAGVVEAGHALAEGQFPVRVAPTQNGGMRYPILQYYGNFPYTACAAFDLLVPGVNPYGAWKIFTFVMLVAGGFFTYRSALSLTRRPLASAVAGAVFVAAPYMLTDLYERGAFTEAVAFCLMPALLYFLMRAFGSRRWRYVALAAVTWALLALSHNITYLYGSTFLGLFFLAQARLNLKYVRRMLRLGAAFVLHTLLVLWSLAAQLYTLDVLKIAGDTGSPMGTAWLTALDILCSPVLATPPGFNSDRVVLGFQVGWPILAAALFALLGVLALPASLRTRLRARRPWRLGLSLRVGSRLPPRKRHLGRVGRATFPVLLLFALSFFMAWSPVDFWAYLPKQFHFAQFPYRLLVFVVVWGSLLAACALALCFPRGVRPWQAALGLLAVGLTMSSYLEVKTGYTFRPRYQTDRKAVQQIMTQPMMGGLEDYFVSTTAAAATSFRHPALDLAGQEFGLVKEGRVQWDVRATVPLPEHGGELVVCGAVVPGEQVPVRFIAEVIGGPRIVTDLTDGREFTAVVPVAPQPGRRTGVVVLMAADRDVANPRAVNVTSITFRPPAGDTGQRLLTAQELKPQTKFGRWTSLRLTTTKPTLAQLPVFYYPGLLDARVNGQPAAYGNVGRLVALELPPGEHHLRVRFAGVGWANVVSGAAWTGLLLVGGWAVLRRLRTWRARRRATRAGGRQSKTSAFRLAGAAVAGFGVVVLGVALPPLWANARQSMRPAFRASAANEAGPEYGAAKAFDGDPKTSWVARGSEPASLTVETGRPKLLTKVELEARRTGLFEAWQVVRVEMSLRGRRVSAQEFSMPKASTEQVQTLTVQPVLTDEIRFEFAQPVVATPTGDPVPPAAVNPGYQEIRLEWAEPPNP